MEQEKTENKKFGAVVYILDAQSTLEPDLMKSEEGIARVTELAEAIETLRVTSGADISFIVNVSNVDINKKSPDYDEYIGRDVIDSWYVGGFIDRKNKRVIADRCFYPNGFARSYRPSEDIEGGFYYRAFNNDGRSNTDKVLEYLEGINRECEIKKIVISQDSKKKKKRTVNDDAVIATYGPGNVASVDTTPYREAEVHFDDNLTIIPNGMGIEGLTEGIKRYSSFVEVERELEKSYSREQSTL